MPSVANNDGNYKQKGKLKEWGYNCNSTLRQEAHIALKQEFEAAIEKSHTEKLVLEEGLLIKKMGDSYCYQFDVSQLIIQSCQPDRPHRLEIRGKILDGSISSAGNGHIVIELASNQGKILHRIEIIFDVSLLLDLVDRRIVDIDRDPRNWNESLANILFNDLNFLNVSSLKSLCNHTNRLDGKSLKDDQISVILNTIKNPFSLIWGPPGSGKTYTLLAVLAEFMANGKSILFASNTNSAIDNVLEKIIGDNCPYPILNEKREKGLIIRLGAQVEKNVSDFFSPKAVAKIKSKEISEKLNSLSYNLEGLHDYYQRIVNAISKWEESKEILSQLETAIDELKKFPSLDELEIKLKDCKENFDTFKTIPNNVFQYVEAFFNALKTQFEKLDNVRERKDAAILLLQNNEAEKLSLEKKYSVHNDKIKEIENSWLKRQFKSKELKELKDKAQKLISDINQSFIKIESVKNSLNNETDQEIQYIKNIQKISEDYKKHNNILLQYLSTGSKIVGVNQKFNPDKNLLEQIKIINKLKGIVESNESIKTTINLINSGWIGKSQIIGIVKYALEKLNSLKNKKDDITKLIDKIKSLEENSPEAAKFIKNYNHEYFRWEPKRDELSDEIDRITSEIKELEKKLEDLESGIIQEAQLICLTMVKASYDRRFIEKRFDALIIDEYSMVSLPQLYCSAALIKERIVLCGDHLQLPPICQSDKETALKWMGQSFFEWHEGDFNTRQNRSPSGPQKLKPHLATLKIQHRMPPEVSHLIRPWYLNEGNPLHDDWNTEADLHIKKNSNHILLNNNITILDTTSTNCYSAKSPRGGRYNIVHAAIVAYLCKEFTENHNIDHNQIVCLTPYRQQNLLTQNLYYQICPKIAPQKAETTWTIHKSQGRGGPIVIYDLTDGKETNLSGFHKQTNPNLLNVALSRTKARIIIICSLRKMAQCLNTKLDNPLRAVFEKMIELNVPVFDAKPYYDIIFKHININDILTEGTVFLTEAQKNGILVLTSREYYKALSYDVLNAKKSITIVSPFITPNQIDKIEPLLLEVYKKSNNKLLIEIITRPPDRMYDRYKANPKRGALIKTILDRLHDHGFKITTVLNTHEKLVIIDERINYWGSLNPLSFKDTDEINTRLEAEGLAHKLLEFAVYGRSELYKPTYEDLSESDRREGFIEIAKKELNALAWKLAGFYGRPRMALMYRNTIESLYRNPPNSKEEYFNIPELSQKKCVLRNHICEIEDIIYPIRGYKLIIIDNKPQFSQQSEPELFSLEEQLCGKDVINKQNCKYKKLGSLWNLGEQADPKMLTRKDFIDSIKKVLIKKNGNSCKKEILPDEIIKFLKIITRGQPRNLLIQKINRSINDMIKQKILKQYTTAAGVIRLKLIES